MNDIAREATAYGCDEVHVIDDPFQNLSKPYGKALTDLCEKVKPEICLMGVTPRRPGLIRVVFVATNLETGLAG